MKEMIHLEGRAAGGQAARALRQACEEACSRLESQGEADYDLEVSVRTFGGKLLATAKLSSREPVADAKFRAAMRRWMEKHGPRAAQKGGKP